MNSWTQTTRKQRVEKLGNGLKVESKVDISITLSRSLKLKRDVSDGCWRFQMHTRQEFAFNFTLSNESLWWSFADNAWWKTCSYLITILYPGNHFNLWVFNLESLWMLSRISLRDAVMLSMMNWFQCLLIHLHLSKNELKFPKSLK